MFFIHYHVKCVEKVPFLQIQSQMDYFHETFFGSKTNYMIL